MRRGKACRKTMSVPAIGMKRLLLKVMPMGNTTLVTCMLRGMACRKTMFVPATGLKKRLPKVMLLHNTISAFFTNEDWV